MAWIYLAESEASPLPWLGGCDLSPTVKSTDTLRASWFLKWERGHYQSPQFGMMCEPLTGASSPDTPKAPTTTVNPSTSLQAAFRARISALQALEQAWTESEAVSFGKSLGSLAIFDPLSCSWKTCQQSLLEAASKWLGPLPRWGMTVDGALYPLQMLGPTTNANAGFYWPTPTVHGNYNRAGASKNSGDGLATAVNMWPSPAARDHRSGKGRKPNGHTPQLCERIGGQLNPEFVTFLMGYPKGWTVVNPQYIMGKKK